MGLIRKSLAVSTLGVVSGSSKKQRAAAAQLAELKTQTALLKQAYQTDEQKAAETAKSDQEAKIKAAAVVFAIFVTMFIYLPWIVPTLIGAIVIIGVLASRDRRTSTRIEKPNSNAATLTTKAVDVSGA